MLRSKLLEHSNLVRFADKLKMEFIEAGSSSSIPPSHADPLSSFARGGTSNWSKKLTASTHGFHYRLLLR